MTKKKELLSDHYFRIEDLVLGNSGRAPTDAERIKVAQLLLNDLYGEDEHSDQEISNILAEVDEEIAMRVSQGMLKRANEEQQIRHRKLLH